MKIKLQRYSGGRLEVVSAPFGAVVEVDEYGGEDGDFSQGYVARRAEVHPCIPHVRLFCRECIDEPDEDPRAMGLNNG